MNFHLDLTRKYPTHKADRKMWKKLNKRSSLQFTASMVEDSNYQDESDKTYMVCTPRVLITYSNLTHHSFS